MSQQIDLEEFLRRSGFGEGGRGGDDDGNGRRPPRPTTPNFFNRWTAIAVVVLILFFGFNWIVTTITEWWWFQAVGFERVWLKSIGAQVGSFVVFFIVSGIVLIGNWLLARRLVIRVPDILGERRLLEERGIGWLIAGAGVFFSWITAQVGATRWLEILRYIDRRPFGTNDPLFNLDVGFYIFELPLYSFVQSWGVQVLFLTLIGVIVIYAASQWENIQANDFLLMPYARKHGAILLALLFFVWALGYQFSIWELVYSGRGVVFGASYTDINAAIPTFRIQMLLLGVAGLVALANYWRQLLRPLGAIVALWLLAGILGNGVYAGILQNYIVEPNELDREGPYIQNNITATRHAFNLHDVERRPLDRFEDVSDADLEASATTLRNVRLWDEQPLEQTYRQLQELRPYYRFSSDNVLSSVDTDRYRLDDGTYRQVMLAARELDKEQLPSRTWVNERLIFTHGYGVVMNPVDVVRPDGQPELWIRDLPPVSDIPGGDIEVTQPALYYGQIMSDYVLVNSEQPEFDYPQGAENVFSHYDGAGGVQITSYMRRLLFSLRMADINIMLSDDITPQTRIMFHRQIRERVERVAPFLGYDSDPYLVIDRESGGLVWIIDAYTISDHYPYATRAMNSRLNYIRNSVKVVIDAYDGSMQFYVADESDPMVQTYASIFPDLFTSMDEMPASLENHIRYPRDLFNVQAQLYQDYHMLDVQVFYNREDRWEVPTQIYEGNEIPLDPYYMVLELPGDELGEPEYILIQPYTPANRQNMIAWLAGRSDVPNHGELIVYEFPKQELIFGPLQVEARIDQNPEISEQLALWDQQGSRVIRGNLLVIPLSSSILYVEPIYLLAETGELPELQRVIAADRNRVVMRETLGAALTALVGDRVPVDVAGLEDGEVPSEGALPEITAELSDLIQQASDQYEAAEQARVDGDWARYGEELDNLQATLEEMQRAVGVEPTPAPSEEPTPQPEASSPSTEQ